MQFRFSNTSTSTSTLANSDVTIFSDHQLRFREGDAPPATSRTPYRRLWSRSMGHAWPLFYKKRASIYRCGGKRIDDSIGSSHCTRIKVKLERRACLDFMVSPSQSAGNRVTHCCHCKIVYCNRFLGCLSAWALRAWLQKHWTEPS